MDGEGGERKGGRGGVTRGYVCRALLAVMRESQGLAEHDTGLLPFSCARACERALNYRPYYALLSP